MFSLKRLEEVAVPSLLFELMTTGTPLGDVCPKMLADVASVVFTGYAEDTHSTNVDVIVTGSLTGAGSEPNSRIAVALGDAIAGATSDPRVLEAGGIAGEGGQTHGGVVGSGGVEAERGSAGGSVGLAGGVLYERFLTGGRVAAASCVA